MIVDSDEMTAVSKFLDTTWKTLPVHIFSCTD